MLTQIARRIEKNYQIKIAVKAFFENLNVPDRICAYVIERLPSDYYKEATQNVDVVTESSASQRPEKTVIQSSFSADSSIHNIVTQQLEIMKAQIAMLSGRDTIVAGTRHVDGLIHHRSAICRHQLNPGTVLTRQQFRLAFRRQPLCRK